MRAAVNGCAEIGECDTCFFFFFFSGYACVCLSRWCDSQDRLHALLVQDVQLMDLLWPLLDETEAGSVDYDVIKGFLRLVFSKTILEAAPSMFNAHVASVLTDKLSGAGGTQLGWWVRACARVCVCVFCA